MGAKTGPGSGVAKISFDARDLAAQVEALSAAEIDALPFGVIRLDPQFVIRVYNATEQRLSGYGNPVGENFFEVAESSIKVELEARIRAAQEQGRVDLELGWQGGKGDAKRELRMRIQSAKDGGVWMFVERD